MITIEKLMEDTNTALCKLFTKVVNGVKIEPEVYDHTDEIFLDGEEGLYTARPMIYLQAPLSFSELLIFRSPTDLQVQ